MDTLTTTSQIDPAVETYYSRVLLERALPALVHTRFAQEKDLPKKSGNTIKFRRYASLPKATTPLVEGVNPAGHRLSKTDIEAQPSKYGDFITLTEEVELTVEDQVLNEANDILGEQAGQTFDEICRDILVASASLTQASNGDNGETPTEMNGDDLYTIYKTLRGNNAKFMTPLIPAGTGVGTSPIRKAYWAIIHTDLLDDLEACSGFKDVANYSAQKGVAEDEEGSVKNIRFLSSSEAHKNTSDSPDTYKIPIIAKNAYGITKLEGEGLRMIYHDAKIAGGPLEVASSTGWKGWFVARILNDAFIHCLEVTHSSSSDE